jgi:hypothetical protein
MKYYHSKLSQLDQQLGSNVNKLISGHSEWFHVIARGGTFTSSSPHGSKYETKLRYDINDSDSCHLNVETQTIVGKNDVVMSTGKTRIIDSTSVDFSLREDAILTFDVKGWVSQQSQFYGVDGVSSNDVLNVYVDGHWIYQASGQDLNGDIIHNENICSMGTFQVLRDHEDGLRVSKGLRYFTVEMITDNRAYHSGGFYEIEFVFKPNSPELDITHEFIIN